MIHIEVPATSANLGPGFDSLGICLTLNNIVSMDEYYGIKISSKDNFNIPQNEENLIYSTVKYMYELCGKTFKGLKIIEENNIPMARGLGSSSACIVAAVVGANYLMGTNLNKDELLNIASQIEGHPDNVAAAMLGGMVSCVMDEKKVYSSKISVPSKLKFIAFIPSFELKTDESRKTLSNTYSRSDAIYNISRTALMVSSMVSSDFKNLKVAVQDKIHQPYRIGLIANADKIFKLSYDLGSYGTYISGAGPTIMSIFDENKLSGIEYKIEKTLKDEGINDWKIKIMGVNHDGVRLFEE